MPARETNAEALALRALVWTLGDSARASRLLDLLRARAGEAALLAATLGFLESYEPDLVACAGALGVAPSELVAARTMLETA